MVGVGGKDEMMRELGGRREREETERRWRNTRHPVRVRTTQPTVLCPNRGGDEGSGARAAAPCACKRRSRRRPSNDRAPPVLGSRDEEDRSKTTGRTARRWPVILRGVSMRRRESEPPKGAQETAGRRAGTTPYPVIRPSHVRAGRLKTRPAHQQRRRKTHVAPRTARKEKEQGEMGREVG